MIQQEGHNLIKKVKLAGTHVGRINRGEEFLTALKSFAIENNIKAAYFSAIGALEELKVAEYDQASKVYREPLHLTHPVEILSCTGNISILDREPFVHAHISVSREVINFDGRKDIHVTGGHLTEAKVFACEIIIQEFEGVELVRDHDPETGLKLWKL